jgi:hypothetical protein
MTQKELLTSLKNGNKLPSCDYITLHNYKILKYYENTNYRSITVGYVFRV